MPRWAEQVEWVHLGATPDAHYNYAPATPEMLNRVRQIESICDLHDVPLAAVSLQFALAHPAVASVLLGASSVRQQSRNADAADVAIPQSLWDDLRQSGLIRPDAPLPAAVRSTGPDQR